ncbi:hypothetical protein [Tissierella sp. Yu-01]|uniref:hypothetical protein n=1 Tax=Tissierella sp. Yu-01 TaxID=3035694 RepID=UPI00240DBE44|nr:hypothetical protein [Tissierella sp. Yu-01]WFA09056.1 hypothetical protein P3962_00370 [Tissierella sp. Yu-01]
MKRFKLLTNVVLIIAILSVGCTSTKEVGIVLDGIDVPDAVLTAAKNRVQIVFDMDLEEYPDYGYINWRIESLDYSYTYEDLDGMQIVIYQMNYEFLSESPENIILAGGMYITEDNWVMPNYPNSTFLIFKQEDDSLISLGTVMINDSIPGEETFTEDIRRIIN